MTWRIMANVRSRKSNVRLQQFLSPRCEALQRSKGGMQLPDIPRPRGALTARGRNGRVAGWYGALLLAVIVSALLDPSPARKDRAGDDLSSTGECAPAV